MKEISSNITKSPADFASFVSRGKWQNAKHLKLINQLLIKMDSRKINRLLINMPPRHGKSEFISIYYPAWHLLKYPDKNIILTTYSNNFAQSFGRKVLELITQNSTIFKTKLKSKAKSSSNFEFENHKGGMLCIGAGSSLTGRGAHLLIIDDPVKNNTEAKSRNKRNSIWDWFVSTVLTRLEPDANAILLMTRWHSDDLSGKILERLPSKKYSNEHNQKLHLNEWVHLSLPAFALPKDPIGRCDGEPLWKNRYDVAALNNIRQNLGAYWFNALYQQNPVQHENAMFKREHFKYFSEDNEYYYLNLDNGTNKHIRKSDCLVNATMDLAISTKENSDFTVAIVFAQTLDHEILILEVIRTKITAPEQIKLIKNLSSRWALCVIGIESVQYQAAFIQLLQRDGFNVKPLKPNKDKVFRAQGMAIRLCNGSVYFRTKADWLTEFEQELLFFPESTHDDQVDAFAYIDNLIIPGKKLMPRGASPIKSKLTAGF